MRLFRVTFCDYARDRESGGDGGVPMTVTEVLELMAEVLTSAGSFVSVMDREGTMIQFMVDEHGGMMLDIPSPRERGSYAKVTDLEACLKVMRDLDTLVRKEAIEGLAFARW
jgi:hypothetical protein